MGDRQQRRLLGQLTDDAHGPVAGGATRAVGHRDERRIELLEGPRRPPQPGLGRLVARRIELDGERDALAAGAPEAVHHRGRLAVGEAGLVTATA